MVAVVDRREFLKLLGVLSSALAVPSGCRLELLAASTRGRFFSAEERAALEALCDRILPADHDPGARELGAADFIERLLTAFDYAQPRIFARGPFSGREPFPDAVSGAPSDTFPPNDFASFLPLSRLQELYWRAEIHGADVAGLPSHLASQRGGELVGLRTRYRDGLRIVDEVATREKGHPFAELAVADQDALVARFDAGADFGPDPVRGRTFFELLSWHTLQGCFAAPEYGGNRNGAGWRMLGVEGDSQPLGYALYSRTEQGYRERPEFPLTRANPDEIATDGTLAPRALSADGVLIQQNISELTKFLELALPGACLPGA